MNYKVKITDTAGQDLRDIAVHIVEQTKDVRLAKKIIEELKTECNRLEMFPDSGAIPRDRIMRSMGYRFTVCRDYLIFYLVDKEKETVNVMAVFNGKRDYFRVMNKYI